MSCDGNRDDEHCVRVQTSNTLFAEESREWDLFSEQSGLSSRL
jgi:hypothetical protein